MFFDVNVMKYTMSYCKICNVMKKDFVLDRRDGLVADTSGSMPNLVQETGIDSHVDQI